MTGSNITTAPLVYNGEVINQRDEMLSLTDMWKAAKEPGDRRPAEWLRSADATRFIGFMSDILSVGISHSDNDVTAGKSGNGLVVTKNGGRSPGTWAHWQVGLAYAKYLSPEFHVWCNSVVRERMMGRPHGGLSPEQAELLRRTDGIARQLNHKSVETDKALTALTTMVMAIAAVIQPGQPILIRHGKTSGQILKASGVKGLKGLSVWLGNRLEQFGCRIENNGCAEMGLTKARLFDPDKAQVYLDNGGRLAIEQKIAERKGQGRLRLVAMKEDRPSA